MDMMVKNTVSAITGMASTDSPVFLPLWLALIGFAVVLSLYRKTSAVYRLAIPYLILAALAYAAPAFATAAGLPALPVTLFFLSGSRVAVSVVMARACEELLNKAWRIFSYILAGTVLAAAAASLVPGSGYAGMMEAAAAVLLAIHALGAAFFLTRVAGKVPAAVRLMVGTIPWGLIWLSAAAVSVAALYGVAIVEPLAAYVAPVLAAADTLMAATVLFAVMIELAKPAPEDTALDDYAAKVSASVKLFIPTEFMDHLQKANLFDLRLGDHVKKEMTIFFSDIRAFTEMSERLTPEESFAFINSYLARVVPVITAHGGFVDKYMGDGIMALFAENGGADQAVESAVEMQKKIIEYNGHRAKVNYRPISMGIGIHTGPLMLGVVGVTDRMEGTVISDAVNLSSRLQSIAKAFNIPLVISERTFMQLGDAGKYKYRFIGKVRVKGKDAPVSVFEIFDGLPDELFERKMRANTFFEQGMLAYYQKDYSQGVFYFKRALEDVHEDGAARFYLETCLRKAMAPRNVEMPT
jgi:two-component system sensor histidine kinase ChiS